MNKDYEIIKPIGLKQPVRMIEQVTENSIRYKTSLITPDPLLIPLDEGNGRNTLCRYALEMYEKCNLFDWTGIDHCIRLSFKDSLSPFSIYEDAAVFANHFAGIVVQVLNEQFASYIYDNNLQRTYIQKTAEMPLHSALIFFTPRSIGKNLERLLSGLRREIRYKALDPCSYTVKELAMITERTVGRLGAICKTTDLISLVSEMIMKKHITTAAAAARLGHELVFRADYTQGSIPVISNELFKNDVKLESITPYPELTPVIGLQRAQ